MNELLSKISSYHLFNYLLPGCLFAVIATAFTHRQFVQQGVVLGLFVYYFYGLLISRVGSLLVQPFLQWIRFLQFSDYREFVAACNKDAKIDILSETNNMYRTLCALIIVLLVLQGITFVEQRYPGFKVAEMPVLIVVVSALLLFSYRKQTAYITERVESNQEP